jgi:hypothetical protein
MSQVLLGSSWSAELKPWWRRPACHPGPRPWVVAHYLVRIEVHLLHGAPELPLLLEQLAREPLGPEQVSEEVRGRVDAFDVGEQDVGTLVLPQFETDPPVAVRRGQGPLEMAYVVVELERPRSSANQ